MSCAGVAVSLAVSLCCGVVITQGYLVVKNSDSFAVLYFAFTLDHYTDAVSLSLLPRTRRGVVTSI